MKKFLLSAGFVLLFAIYVVYQRVSGSSAATPLASVGSSSSSSTPNATTPSATTPQTTSSATVSYKDGTYTGSVTDAFYGNVQVKATVQSGKITDVAFLSYPQDRQNSVRINSQATPLLRQEAIRAQSANVDVVSGATATSEAFIQSLQSALTQAQA